MKVMPVEFLLLFSLKIFMIIIFFYLAVGGKNEPFRVTPPTSSG